MLVGHFSNTSCDVRAAFQVRLKVKDWFSIRALPNQIVKVNKRWQLGNSPVALRVNYECPWENLSNPLRAPARLMVRCDSSYNLATHAALLWRLTVLWPTACRCFRTYSQALLRVPASLNCSG